MRARVSIRNPNGDALPFNHLYYLSSMLYHRLAEADVELANEAHEPGEFRQFNFSRVQPDEPYQVIKKEDGGLKFDTGHFIITSPDREFIQSYCEGLLKDPEFHLGGCEFLMESVEVLPENGVSERETLRTLSPIYVKTFRRDDETGELKDWDLYPKDGKWYEKLHQNLLRRYEDYHGHPPDKDHFDVTDVRNVNAERETIRNSHRRCTTLTMDLEASKELMRFALDAGLGEKTGMGFGCMEVVG